MTTAITMPRHLLSVADLDTDQIRTILDTAASMQDVQRREVKKIPTLRGRTVINLFFEDSTRTRTSFEMAGKWPPGEWGESPGRRLGQRPRHQRWRRHPRAPHPGPP